MTKYEKVKLPLPTKALEMAKERKEWAKEARDRDQHGSAKEFELTALLLEYYAMK